jgi:quercetin dioxygenase-like cupin family protein
MAKAERAFVDPNNLEWVDASSSTNLPRGMRIKVLARDEAAGVRSTLVSFPPGYFEPRHTHGIAHATFLLRGRWIVEGKAIGPGGYIFGPSGLPHGPFESPEGSLVCGSDVGTDEWHQYPPTAEQEAKAVPTIIIDPGELEWQEAAGLLDLPAGVRVKIYNQDDVTGRIDFLAQFPPGHIEPCSADGPVRYRCYTLLEGRWIADGVAVGLAGHILAHPGAPVGPFECPEGAVVCAATFLPPTSGAASELGEDT